MGTKDWKDDVRHHFENTRLLERCQADTVDEFNQFCEFIAEAAFESLQDELALYRVRSRYDKTKGRSIQFAVCFPEEKIVQFFYKIILPKNSIELKMKLIVRGRKSPKSETESKELDLFPDKTAAELLKLTKEDLIANVLEHYKNFTYEAMTSEE